MEYRLNKTAIGLVTALLVVAAGLFIYTSVSAPEATEEAVSGEYTAQHIPAPQLITAKHRYSEGMHTIAGSVELSTPCHRVSAEPFFVDGTSTVEVRFVTRREANGTCPLTPTNTPFRVSFEAPEEVTIGAAWHGASVSLNLIPVGAGEILEGDIEVKG